MEATMATTKVENIDLIGDLDKLRMRALMNPFILDKVFSALKDTSSLKASRLVCTTWSDVATGYLGRRGSLLFSSKPTKELASFDHQLAKNVTLYMKCCCYEVCACSSNIHLALPTNFEPVLPKICGSLKTIQFIVGIGFKPRLHDMWLDYQFPNLTRISIFASQIGSEEDDIKLDKFHPLPNLKIISFRILPGYKMFSSTKAGLSLICQKLLNAATNLDELSLQTNFYLDLNKCRKLKKFGFEYQESRDVFTRDVVQFDHFEMDRMLKSCRNSLERLSLNYSTRRWHAIEYIKLNFDFPNLTELKIGASDVFKVDDCLNIIDLPNLTHLFLDTSDSTDLPDIVGTLHLPHDGITSLHVVTIHDGEVGEEDVAKLGKLYPSVTQFKLDLSVEFIPHLDENFDSLKKMFESFGQWGLTSGQISVRHALPPVIGRYREREFDSDIVFAVLEGMKEWKGLSNTCLDFLGDYDNISFKLSDRLRNAVESCSAIRNLATRGYSWY